MQTPTAVMIIGAIGLSSASIGAGYWLRGPAAPIVTIPQSASQLSKDCLRQNLQAALVEVNSRSPFEGKISGARLMGDSLQVSFAGEPDKVMVDLIEPEQTATYQGKTYMVSDDAFAWMKNAGIDLPRPEQAARGLTNNLTRRCAAPTKSGLG